MNDNHVRMAQYKICRAPEKLSVVGLGSCVAVALRHERTKTAGLVHIMLPNGRLNDGTKPGKYADTAVKILCQELQKRVGGKGRITAKIAGGAQMFKMTNNFSIGKKNVDAVKEELKRLRIKIVGEDTGKNYGRTIVFDPESGEMTVKCIYGETKI